MENKGIGHCQEKSENIRYTGYLLRSGTIQKGSKRVRVSS